MSFEGISNDNFIKINESYLLSGFINLIQLQELYSSHKSAIYVATDNDTDQG